MKKLTLALISCLFISIVVNAQTEKGTWLLGGDVTYVSAENISTFSASPGIGYFVTENLAIGAQLAIISSDGFSSWAVGPYGRYYFTKNTSGKPFLGAGINFGGATGGDTRTGFSIEGGYAVFLNKSISLEIGAAYNRTSDVNIFGAGVGFQIHFKK
jgi:outer membrane protein